MYKTILQKELEKKSNDNRTNAEFSLYVLSHLIIHNIMTISEEDFEISYEQAKHYIVNINDYKLGSMLNNLRWKSYNFSKLDDRKVLQKELENIRDTLISILEKKDIRTNKLELLTY